MSHSHNEYLWARAGEGSGSFLMVCCGKGGHHFHVTHFGILTKTDGVILIYFGFNSLCAAMC